MSCSKLQCFFSAGIVSFTAADSLFVETHETKTCLEPSV